MVAEGGEPTGVGEAGHEEEEEAETQRAGDRLVHEKEGRIAVNGH